MTDTIIFDFGGVLLDLNFERTFEELSRLTGIDISSALEAEHPFSRIYLAYEQGLINDETLLWNIQKITPHNLDPRLVVDAWNAMLLDGIQPDVFDMLLELREKHRIYLLSNTNHMHISWVHRYLRRHHQITDFENRYFDRVYYSYKIHLRKPDQAIYDYVANDASLNLGTTLFIDDSEANVLSAREAGWRAVLHDPSDQHIKKAINDYLSH